MYSQGSQKLIQYLKMVCKVLKTWHFSLICGIIGTNGDSAPPPLRGSFWVEE